MPPAATRCASKTFCAAIVPRAVAAADGLDGVWLGLFGVELGAGHNANALAGCVLMMARPGVQRGFEVKLG